MVKSMIFLPISINITNKKILLIGGGKVALEKITSLKQFTKSITIVTEKADSKVAKHPYEIKYKLYEKDDLNGFFMVYACTNNPEKNMEIKADCQAKGLLVNIVDNPALCDFISPAIFKQDNMTVSVSSNGQEVRKSISWRNRLKEVLKNY